MGHNGSHPELATTVYPCPVCFRETHVGNRDGMVFHHPERVVAVGEHPAPWCQGGGTDYFDHSRRLQPVPVSTPHREGSGCEVFHQMPTELAQVNPRLVRVHLWDNPQCHVVRLPVGFIDAAPDGEQLSSYAWLARVTQQLHGFVGSVTAAYSIAKMLHQARWPEGTPELPAGTLVRRRLEREKEV